MILDISNPEVLHPPAIVWPDWASGGAMSFGDDAAKLEAIRKEAEQEWLRRPVAVLDGETATHDEADGYLPYRAIPPQRSYRVRVRYRAAGTIVPRAHPLHGVED